MGALRSLLDRLPLLTTARRRSAAARAEDGSAAPAAVYAALDVGTEVAKALVFETRDGEGVVTGAGRQRQGLADMQGGTITNIRAVVANCDAALEQAERMAGMSPEQVVMGIAGELVRGGATTVSVERSRPEQRLSRGELEKLVEQAQRQALQQISSRLVWETGLKKLDVRLVDAAIIEMKIDGHKVSDPIGFQGRHVEITVFNAFAPLVHLGALQSVAGDLGLDLFAIVTEPYAVARCLASPQAVELGAIFLDIGGGTTDVALVRNGGIESTRMFALGGRAFTKRLAQALELDFDQAEELKLRYATGVLDDVKAKQVREVLEADTEVWRSGVELVLEELAGEEVLPPRFFLCGGGSQLPELKEALESYPWQDRLPFARRPTVRLLQPRDVRAVRDATGQLRSQQDVTPLALAYQAVELEQEQDTLDDVLHTVIRWMRI
jgi:cell division protein FtsA